jgi:hypothetical protein
MRGRDVEMESAREEVIQIGESGSGDEGHSRSKYVGTKNQIRLLKGSQ